QAELHYLAMKIVGRDLQDNGVEFLSVNSKPKKNPQVVWLKEKKVHFIKVRAIKYPQNPRVYDTLLVGKVKKHALKFNATTHYAGVALANASDHERPIIKNQKYIVDYDGIIEVENQIYFTLFSPYMLLYKQKIRSNF